jgi:hypothetical protein
VNAARTPGVPLASEKNQADADLGRSRSATPEEWPRGGSKRHDEFIRKYMSFLLSSHSQIARLWVSFRR